MEQISDFTIHGFRGLQELKIDKLGQINLLVGNNNSGKTSVLEAFSIFCDPFNGRRWYETGMQREGIASYSRFPITDRVRWLFPRNINSDVLPENDIIAISAQGRFPITKLSASYEKFTEMVTTQKSSLRSDDVVLEDRDMEIEGLKVFVSVSGDFIQQPTLFDDLPPIEKPIEDVLTFSDRTFFPGNNRKHIPILPVQIVNPLLHRSSELSSGLWSEVVEADLKSETIDLLRFFDPGIQDIDIIFPSERARPLVSVKHALLGRAPLHTFGDGLRRVFTLATTIPRVKKGLLLIDELVTAIHTRALEKTFSWFAHACISNNIQLIATTHSLEALDALLETTQSVSNLAVYRLQQKDGQTTATRFSRDIIVRLRKELGMEVRY